MNANVRQRLIRQALADAKRIEQHLDDRMAQVADWASAVGFPSGNVGGTRGGESDPLPLRKVLGSAGGDPGDENGDGSTSGPWRPLDAIAADDAEAQVTLALWVEQGAWLRAFIDRNTPRARGSEVPKTGTCGNTNATGLKRGCGRVVACTANDPLSAGLCTACYKLWWASFQQPVVAGETYHA